ncbi:MAG TPA: methyltransferase domain-containing protein [Terracidiphilus sp.]|jgi:trans-aconitate methyltransferase|nr:methyltransferase domain-containing protein [Terracidiphilus sp.]
MSPEVIQFAQRAQLIELMDEPCSYAEFRGCLRDLIKVNQAVFSYRPTLRWLQQFRSTSDAPLHIVDVGSGAGDMLRRIESWARRNNIAVQLTGIDRNPFAAQAAREFSAPDSRIEWLSCDAFTYQPPVKIDLVISSLFTHHLPDPEIVRFLQWMEQVSARGWFINDLRRAQTPYYAFKLLAAAMRWHRFVQHDGPVSIQRSFTPRDWHHYIHQAGLNAVAIDVFDAWPARLCLARVK